MSNDEVRDGAWAFYYDDDTPEIEAVYDAGTLESIAVSNDAGEMVYQRTLGETDVLQLFGPAGTLTYTRTDTARALRLTSWNGEELLSRRCELMQLRSPEDFVDEFEDFYGTLGEEFDLGDLDVDFALGVDGFHIDHAEVRREEQFFDAAVIAESSGGDTLVVIEETGDFEGRVFANYHDEGLFDLETVDEYVADHVDEETASDRNAVIEEMPFVENELADTLTDLFEAIDLQPYDELELDHLEPARHG